MQIITHEAPVRRDESNYIARVDLAKFDLEGEAEQVWLQGVGEGRFKLCCIPFRAYGLSLGDEVGLSADGVTVVQVYAKSGNRTMRALLMPGSDAREIVEKICENISQLRLESEWSGDRHVAVNIPEGVDLSKLIELADKYESDGRLYWEWSDVMPFPSEG
jgi:hypothetical protein